MRRWGWPLFMVACGASGPPSLSLSITGPDGSKTSLNAGGKGWQYDSLGVASISWPYISEWGTSAERGLSVDFIPGQPGTYDTVGFLYLGGDFYNAEQSQITLHVDDVTWTGNTVFPFVYAGTLEGASTGGSTFEGSFTFRNLPCNGYDASSNCAGRWPTSPAHEQVWEVVSYTGLESCPAAFASRFAAGDVLTIPPGGVATVGGHEVECIMESDYKGLCGASEDVVVDGVTWRFTTSLYQGNTYASDAPDLIVRGGVIDPAGTGTCLLYADTLAPVRGTGLDPNGI